MRILRTLPLLAIVFLWSSAAAHAQTLTVDSTLTITGTLGASAAPTRHVTLSLTGGTGTEAKTIQVRRSDLTKDGSNEIIDRGNVSVAAVSLKPGQTQDAAVTINNVTRAGTYTGTIKFWLPEQTENDAQITRLTLQVGPRIVVNPPTGGSSAHVAHCGIFPCSWSGWLPQNLIGSKRGLLLDNQTVGNVTVETQEITLRGERTGRILTATDVRPSIGPIKPPDCGANCLPSNRQVPIELEIVDRDNIPPDSYVGGVRFGLVGTDTPTVAAYTLNVRGAPWWPLVVLLLGIIVGRIVKDMSTPEALLQVKLLKRLFRIQDSVSELRSVDDQKLMIRRLDDLKERIESGSETEQTLTQELDKLEVTARLLRRLEALKEEALRLTNETLREAILAKIEEATVKLLEDDTARCTQLIAEIEQMLRQPQPDTTDNVRVNSVLDFTLEAKAAGENAAQVFNAPSAPQPGRPERMLAWLAGSDLIGAGARFWVLRPIFFLLLLFLLTLIGLKSLYIDNGTNFGVGGIYDYLGLFLWGLSAQVVQNTLQNISLPRP